MTMSPPVRPVMNKMLTALTKYAAPVTARFDSWVNTVTGFGTSSDKTTYGAIVPSRDLTDAELSALYHSDDMAARMIDVVPQEMMREPFSVETGDADLDEIITDKFNAIDVRGALADGIRWARAFGGGGCLIGADDGRDADRPLAIDRVRDLNYLYPVDRRLLWPLSYYETPGPKFGQPETFAVTVAGGYTYSNAVVHESRLILFRGAPTGIRERQQRQGWDLSYLQRAFDVLRSFNSGWTAVETLLTDGNQAVFKMTGLAEAIASGNTEAMTKRLQIVQLYRSVMRALVIDADAKEEFSRNSASFAEIPGVLDKFMLRLAAAVQMPVTILMGQSPAGMNATGESDFRWFYDRIRAAQNTDLAPKIRHLVSIWLRSKASPLARGGKLPKSISVKFPALWTETPMVQAQREAAIATRDATYIQAQVLLPDEVAIARFRPGGFDDELRITPAGLVARERALKVDLDKLGTEEPAPPADPGGFGGGPPAMGGPPAPKQLPPAVAAAGSEERSDVTDEHRTDALLEHALSRAGDSSRRLTLLAELCWEGLDAAARERVDSGDYARNELGQFAPGDGKSEDASAGKGESGGPDAKMQKTLGGLAKTIASGKLAPGLSLHDHVAIATDAVTTHAAELDRSIQELKALAPKGASVKGRTKELESVLGKLERKPSYGSADKFQDITGMRVVVNDLAGVHEAVQAIRAHYSVVSEDNYIANPLGPGAYRSHHLIVEAKGGGLKKEIQVRTKDQNRHAEWAHAVYKPKTEEQTAFLVKHAPAIERYSKLVSDHFQAKAEGRSGTRMPKPPPGLAENFGVVK